MFDIERCAHEVESTQTLTPCFYFNFRVKMIQNDPEQFGIYVFGVGVAALEAGLLKHSPQVC